MADDDDAEQLKAKIRELEVKEKKLEDQAATFLPGSQEWLALQQSLAAIRQRLLTLEQVRQQQLGAAGGVAAAPNTAAFGAEVEEACFRALKRSKAEESLWLSEMGSEDWAHIAQASGLKVESVQLPACSTGRTGSSSPEAFSWEEKYEGSQSDRYMPHLKKLFPLPTRTSNALTWLEGGNTRKQLLTTVDTSGKLFFSKISVNVDAAIVTRAAVDVDLPQTGICVLFELKKSLDSAATYQAMCQLLLANMHSPTFQPVQVVTDLQDDWRLLWLDGHTVRVAKWPSRAVAVAMINSLVTAAATAASSACPAGSKSMGAAASGIPEMIAQRQPLYSYDTAVATTDTANLADLAGLLPDAELKAAQAMMLMQQLLQVPALSGMAVASGSDFPSHMFI